MAIILIGGSFHCITSDILHAVVGVGDTFQFCALLVFLRH